MTSKEVVSAAIHFQTPDRLPLQMEALGMTDTAGASIVIESERSRTGLGNDEYGCSWHKTEAKNMGQVKGHPISSFQMIPDYPLPDYRSKSHIQLLEERIHAAEEENKYVCTGHFMLLFERMQALCGFEEVLTGLYLYRERMDHLADRLVEVVLQKVHFLGENFGKRVHGFNFTEDWGTQADLIVDPGLWREFFKPRYKKLFDAMHQHGWDIWMHSCGKVNRIIGDLIEVGCDVINLQQPRALGIEEVGKEHAGRITFQSLCDIQATLPYGSAEDIEQDVDDLLKYWATPKGGFILSDYGDGEAIGVPLKRKELMLDLFLKKDPYRRSSFVDAE